VLGAESAFDGRTYAPDDAVKRAMEIAAKSAKPVILVDTQDNPGAGTNADTVGLLEALAGNGADAVLGMLCDPRAAAMAHAAGVGAEIDMAIGAWSGLPGHRPYCARFQVESLGDGNFTATGAFYRGSRMRLGPMALLKILGTEVRIALTTLKQQAADQAMFRHLGVEPARQRVLALKSTVHFRADFQAIAEDILIVAAPGPNPVDHRQLGYRRLRRGVRIMPMGPEV
jgi:microcystin degradation protein MlrC